MITRIVKLTFKESMVEDFRKFFAEIKPQIKAFEGCEKVELLRDIYRPEVFFTLSVWHSTIDLENYRTSDFFNDTWSKTSNMFADRAKAWSLVEEKE